MTYMYVNSQKGPYIPHFWQLLELTQE